jgi:hypothetical protein|tara:strand:+ start:1639 stop:2538 length:900 start_codon:yes stop_codon:yes gene_type:complete
MSTSINNAFITQYERDVHDVFQRQGSVLKPSVRFKSDVVGSVATFQKIGTGTATTKARHGTITPMNQTHTAVSTTLADFYAGDWVDKLDEAKINIDERAALARGGAMALGRKVDSQILTELDTTTQTTVTITVTTSNQCRNGLLDMVEAMIANDAYEPGAMYGVMSPHLWAVASTISEFASSDYVGADGLPYNVGAAVGMYKRWGQVLWTVHSGVPNVGTATSKVFIWNKNAIGYAAGKTPANLAGTMGGETSVGADITWHGDRAAHFVNHAMSGNAVLIDDAGVIEGNLNDTAAIPTA